MVQAIASTVARIVLLIESPIIYSKPEEVQIPKSLYRIIMQPSKSGGDEDAINIP